MLTINTFSLCFLIKLNNELYLPIQLYSTKLSHYGSFFIGDICIPNNLLKACPSEKVSINIIIKIKRTQYSHMINLIYSEPENAWLFLADKHLIKYDIYTLTFPLNLEFEANIKVGETPTIYKKSLKLTIADSLIFLPETEGYISLEILESNYLIKVNNIPGPFELIITAINTNIIKKIRLTQPSERFFLSGEPNGYLLINEIFIKYIDKVYNIVLNRLTMFNEPFFVRGTLIKTSTGFKPIESIKTGTKILNQRGRLIDVISTNSSLSLWAEGVLFKKNDLIIHKDIKTLGKDGILQSPEKEGLVKANKREVCGEGDVFVCYSLEIASPADKLILTDEIIVDSFLNKNKTKRIFITIYSQKFIKEIV